MTDKFYNYYELQAIHNTISHPLIKRHARRHSHSDLLASIWTGRSRVAGVSHVATVTMAMSTVKLL